MDNAKPLSHIRPWHLKLMADAKDEIQMPDAKDEIHKHNV